MDEINHELQNDIADLNMQISAILEEWLRHATAKIAPEISKMGKTYRERKRIYERYLKNLTVKHSLSDDGLTMTKELYDKKKDIIISRINIKLTLKQDETTINVISE